MVVAVESNKLRLALLALLATAGLPSTWAFVAPHAPAAPRRSSWHVGAPVRRGSPFVLCARQVSPEFEKWDKDGSGRIDQSELWSFVEFLRDRAFVDDEPHEGWMSFQVRKIREELLADKDFITPGEFDQLLTTVSQLTLFENQSPKTIAVLGAGAFGVAMAVALGTGGHNVRLLITSSHKSPEELQPTADVINNQHVYPAGTKVADQLPEGYRFPSNVHAVVEVSAALDGAVDYVVSAIPAQATYAAVLKYKPCIPPGVPVCTVSKGICSSKFERDGTTPSPTYLCTMDEVITLALGEGRNPVVGLAGPSFAKMICEGEPTAVTVACRDESVAREVALAFSTPLFRQYYTTDVVGAELSGALKNVVAIACGMCLGCPAYKVPALATKKLQAAQQKITQLVEAGMLDPGAAHDLQAMVAPENVIAASIQTESAQKKGGPGLGLGPNALNLLLTRAWEDVRKICVAKGARSETLLSLSGMGDLMLTCFGGESRNAKFGGILGGAALAGTAEADASQATPTVKFVLSHPEIYPVCEGYYTSLALRDLASQLDIEIPVLGKMCDVLAGDMDPRDLIATVMTEPVSPEFDPAVTAGRPE